MFDATRAAGLAEIEAAQRRLKGRVLRTPLVRLNMDAGGPEVYLKLENLQPFGSFKVRGAGNFIHSANPSDLARGVWTASAGNMAQALAYFALRVGLPCTAVVPDTAPQAKVDNLRQLGVTIVTVTMAGWLEIYNTHTHPEVDGLFVPAFAHPAVMAGNGTIGLEILEDLPDVEAVIAPYGGGGLSCGIASALKVLRPDVKVFACEVATAAPLAASFAAAEPTTIDYQPSFVDGIGAPFIFEQMWPLAQDLLAGSLVVEVKKVAEAVRLLLRHNRIVAEGAGAAPLAAALEKQAGMGKVVCIVSGGNIDLDKVAKIIKGEMD